MIDRLSNASSQVLRSYCEEPLIGVRRVMLLVQIARVSILVENVLSLYRPTRVGRSRVPGGLACRSPVRQLTQGDREAYPSEGR